MHLLAVIWYQLKKCSVHLTFGSSVSHIIRLLDLSNNQICRSKVIVLELDYCHKSCVFFFHQTYFIPGNWVQGGFCSSQENTIFFKYPALILLLQITHTRSLIWVHTWVGQSEMVLLTLITQPNSCDLYPFHLFVSYHLFCDNTVYFQMVFVDFTVIQRTFIVNQKS